MAELEELKAFNFNDSSPVLWTFKGPRGKASEDPSYTGRWVETTDDVKQMLKETVREVTSGIEELFEYGLTAENHDTSALLISAIETHAGIITDLTSAEIDPHKVKRVEHLRNSNFYLIKLTVGEDVLYAIRKTGDGWKTKSANNIRSIIFSDEELDVDKRPHFELFKTIDLLIYKGSVFSLGKKKQTESILRYKQAQENDFAELQAEQEFTDIF
ncbi:Kiwa anti-phage protein KwaB-like domain-containing protein, partial [Hyphomonas sp.]|uniref:Kiwa anti-phage protein KwaB-like domain-containing protein n=1 Tax=Hyphomonas sp. TaxID=87 RepID=UPI003241EBE6